MASRKRGQAEGPATQHQAAQYGSEQPDFGTSNLTVLHKLESECGASEWASEWARGQANGPRSRSQALPNHRAAATGEPCVSKVIALRRHNDKYGTQETSQELRGEFVEIPINADSDSDSDRWVLVERWICRNVIVCPQVVSHNAHLFAHESQRPFVRSHST